MNIVDFLLSVFIGARLAGPVTSSVSGGVQSPCSPYCPAHFITIYNA